MPKPYKKKEQEIVEEDKKYGEPRSTSPKTSALMRDDSQNYDGSNFVVPSVLDPTVPNWRNPTPEADTSRNASWNTWLSDMRDEDDGNPDQDLEGLPQMGGWSVATFPYSAPEPKSPPSSPIDGSSYLRQYMDSVLADLQLDPFKFDLNGEELYQQYRDQYLRNGRLAMMDSMGKAAGLTGGYGSSYAQNVGQQTYQGYVNDLNNIVPNVYSAAYQRWRDAQGDKFKVYGLASDAANTEKQLEASRQKAELDADTERRKLDYDAAEAERKYGLEMAKLNRDREDAMIKSGQYAYDSNGNLVYTGRYIVNGNDVVDKVDLAVQDYFNKMTAQGNEAFNSAMAAMEGIAVSSNTDVAEVIADVILQQNGWDATYRPDVLNYVREMLKED